jgi:hypothetical protein
MSMTVSELIMELEQLDPDAEVRLACQQSWPFEYTIKGVTTASAVGKADQDVEDTMDDIIYLVEGEQLGYFTSTAWDAV